MAKRILLPTQLFNLRDLTKQFPGPPFNFEKLIFQCELREVTTYADAIFGVIGYPLWKKGNAPREPWIVGKKVSGLTIGPADPNNPDESFPIISSDPDDPYTAFGNNEILLFMPSKDESKKSAYKIEDYEKFISLYNSTLKDQHLLDKSTLSFSAHISKNPHVYYDVTLSSGGSSNTVPTNPCPPNQPGE